MIDWFDWFGWSVKSKEAMGDSAVCLSARSAMNHGMLHLHLVWNPVQILPGIGNYLPAPRQPIP